MTAEKKIYGQEVVDQNKNKVDWLIEKLLRQSRPLIWWTYILRPDLHDYAIRRDGMRPFLLHTQRFKEQMKPNAKNKETLDSLISSLNIISAYYTVSNKNELAKHYEAWINFLETYQRDKFKDTSGFLMVEENRAVQQTLKDTIESVRPKRK